MEKEKALKLIFQSAELYNQNFCNQMLLIISANKSLNKTFSVEIQFDKTNFLHLTGVKFLPRSSISPSVFFDRCIAKRLSVNDFEMSADGTTEQKLAILPQMLNSVNLSANMIGDFQGRRPALITDKLVGNVRGCLGIVYDSKRDNFAPNTVLNLDMRQEVQNQQRIIAIYKKGKSESNYETLVYKAKKICWERISFPDSYSYIPVPQD